MRLSGHKLNHCSGIAMFLVVRGYRATYFDLRLDDEAILCIHVLKLYNDAESKATRGHRIEKRLIQLKLKIMQ